MKQKAISLLHQIIFDVKVLSSLQFPESIKKTSQGILELLEKIKRVVAFFKTLDADFFRSVSSPLPFPSPLFPSSPSTPLVLMRRPHTSHSNLNLDSVFLGWCFSVARPSGSTKACFFASSDVIKQTKPLISSLLRSLPFCQMIPPETNLF